MDDERVSIYSTDNRVGIAIYPNQVFASTEAGRAQLHEGGSRLGREALAVLVMLDGKRTVGDLEHEIPDLPPATLREAVRVLLAGHFIREKTLAELGEFNIDMAAFLSAAGDGPELSAGTAASAQREAARGVSTLQSAGFYMSLARRGAQAPRAPVPPVRVLVVEDDPDVSRLEERVLRKAGISVDIAASRAQVVQRLNSKPSPDLVLLDITLPGLNGFELLKRLKQHPVLKALPVVMLTADAHPESVARGLMLGADGYITKPFDSEALVRGVKAMLGAA